MKVLEYIQHESDRQSATPEETINMVDAWCYANHSKEFPALQAISNMSWLITRRTGYRFGPAVFNQGRDAIAPHLIERTMETWHKSISSQSKENLARLADDYIKDFLDIHPFVDGNGRVASLLWNHAKNTLLDPEPLPYFYGDN